MKRNIGGSYAVPPIGLVLLTACALGVGLFTADLASSAPPAAANQKITLYSLAVEEQFVNNADDRQRGQGNNPFGNFKDLTATTKEHGNGPFPGDQALFKFKIYTTKDLKTTAGSAIFTCLYNFDKNAYCAATYELSGGTLVGAGAFNFNASTFSLAITGGTGKYRGMTGDVASSAAPFHSQRLTFTLG